MDNLVFKVSIVGPSRVGKTSLIAALLANAEKYLEGSPVTLKPTSLATEKRLSHHQRELEGSILAGEIESKLGGLSGTQEANVFELKLSTIADSSLGMNIHLLDFPGGWIDPGKRTKELSEEWDKCKKWIGESSILMIPIDATILMESETSKHRASIPTILGTPEVKSVVKEWAKARREHAHKDPALLILCPVKCETYFNDNGGMRNASRKLLDEVRSVYQGIIDVAIAEEPACRIMYCPIDTLGCVEVKSARWQESDGNGLELEVFYKFRYAKKIKPKAIESLLISISKQLVSKIQEEEASKTTNLENEAKNADDLAAVKSSEAKNAGFFDKVSDWFNDKGWNYREREASRACQDAKSKGDAATLAQQRMISAQDAMKMFAGLKKDERVHDIYPL